MALSSGSLRLAGTVLGLALLTAGVLGVIFISWCLRKATPLYIQGTVECTTYKASSKVPGRIEEMKVEEGQHVTKGELLYTLSTPELRSMPGAPVSRKPQYCG